DSSQRKIRAGRRIAGDQIHRTRLRDQSGIRLIDDDEIEREKPRGSRGDAARLSRFGDGRNGRGAADVGRSSNDAGRAKISSAGQVRHASLAGGRAGVVAKRRRSDYFDRNRFCRAATPWFARLGGAYWKERCLTIQGALILGRFAANPDDLPGCTINKLAFARGS